MALEMLGNLWEAEMGGQWVTSAEIWGAQAPLGCRAGGGLPGGGHTRQVEQDAQAESSGREAQAVSGCCKI